MKNPEDFIKLAENLWIEVYERGFIELEDVEHYQRWIETLVSVGHQFFQPQEKGISVGENKLNFNVGQSTQAGLLSDLPDNCKNLPTKTFWTSDLHGGSRADTPSVLTHLGQDIIMAGHKGVATHYPKVFKNEHVTVNKNLSNLVHHNYHYHYISPSQKQLSENYEFFKNDPVIAKVDGFICQFPAAMCELWLPFKKSILFTPVHRYQFL